MARPGRITSPVAIRDFEDSDVAAVIALARELQSHERPYFDRLRPPEEFGDSYVAHLKAEVAKHKGRFLVAVSAGAIVGYATLLFDDSSADRAEEVLYDFARVGDLSVSKTHRGAGIGKAIIAECERLAREAGVKWLRLGVLAGNESARKFYASCGMTEIGLTLEKPLS